MVSIFAKIRKSQDGTSLIYTNDEKQMTITKNGNCYNLFVNITYTSQYQDSEGKTTINGITYPFNANGLLKRDLIKIIPIVFGEISN